MSFKVVKLGEVCTFVRGLTYSKSDEVEFSSNVVIRANNIDLNTHTLNFNELRYIDDSIVIKDDKKIKKNDILICTASGSKSHLGKVALVEQDLSMAFGGFMGALRADSRKILPEYLYRLLISDLFKNHVDGLSDGANINNLKFSQIENLEIPLPSLETQQKIVQKLDAIFTEIDRATVATEANIKNAEALFKRYLKKTFEENFDWKKATIGEVLSVIKNGINCEQNKTPVGNKITRIETIAQKKFDFKRVGFATLNESEKERSRLQYGDILFSHINSPIHVGKTAIYESEEEIYHGINLLLMRTHDNINPFFFNYFLNHLFATGYWERNCKKSVNQASVNQKDISKVEFSYPQTSIQQKLVVKFNSLSLELSKFSKSYANKLIELSILKQSILKQAFNGELVKE